MPPVSEDRTDPSPTAAPPCRTAPQPRRAAPRPRRRNPLLAAALTAAERGLHVFPLRPGSKVPAAKNWEQVATCNPDQIHRWWSKRPWNIGVATGPSGLLVVDLDPGRGDSPPDEWAGARSGRDVLARQAAAHHQPMPMNTLTVATPSGGQHLYFHQPPGQQLHNTQGRWWRVDTRGHGGYVVGVGSRRGADVYQVVRGDAIAELPPWLAAALTPPPPAPRPARPPVATPAVICSRRAAAYLHEAVNGELEAVTQARPGQRHTTLLCAARRLGQWIGGELLDEGEAREALRKAAKHYDGVQGYTEAQVERDIGDGLAYGARDPRDLPAWLLD